MWMVAPLIMCDKHLLGEHVELHMFVGAIRKGTSLRGYVENGLVEVHNIVHRHDQIAVEMTRRGMSHTSLLPPFNEYTAGSVPVHESLRDLLDRCPDCSTRLKHLRATGDPS
jgi:hypothetical protein